MAKIRISTKQNAFTFSVSPENREQNNNVNLTQTNIINTDSMIFTTNYVYKNIDVVSSFINGLAIQRQISKVIVKDMDLANLSLLIVQNIKSIVEFTISSSEDVSFEVYERLLFSPNIKKLNCYNLKDFMLEQLDKKGIDVSLRREIFFLSNFMSDNNINNYSSIYYKKTIDIIHPLEAKDIEDIEIFCKVNKYLKIINIISYSKESIRNIINILARQKKKNIKINIIQDESNIIDIVASMGYLKMIQSKVKKSYNYKLSIIYSNEYKKKNIINQLTINNIKICCILVIVMIGLALVVMEYNNLKAVDSINDINRLISSEINDISKSYDNVSKTDNQSDNETTAYIAAYKDVFSALISKNDETVGYLKVNNTNIDYPVVKAVDNKYYLGNDFYKKKNTFGWVFMDYKNDPKNLSNNTIIYGHNSYKGIMFGTLTNVMNNEWYTNSSNLIINFNTTSYIMEWKIFSIYEIKVTSDYLQTTFDSKEEFANFLNMLKSRSIYDFNVNLTDVENILTLSTCVNNSKGRAVVHAVLVKKIPIK